MTDALHSEDLAIAARVVNGDLNSFENIVDTYQTAIRNYCTNMLRSRAEGEEHAQEVFLKAYQSVSTFRGDCSIRTWLYRIAKNVCIDTIRRRRSFIERIPVLRQLTEEHRSINAEGILSDSQIVNRLLAVLSEDERSIFLLRHQDGLPIAEIAVLHEASIDSVKSRLKRLLKKLQQEYSNLDQGQVKQKEDADHE